MFYFFIIILIQISKNQWLLDFFQFAQLLTFHLFGQYIFIFSTLDLFLSNNYYQFIINKNQKYLMGNNQCGHLCQDQKTEVIKHIDYNPQIIPQLSKEAQVVLQNKKPFAAELAAEHQICTKKFGTEVYEGPVDFVNRPEGYGKMYKDDGSIVISHFKEGKAIGPSICVFKDGSYYQGKLLNNIAEDQQGRFQNKQMIYFGSFKNNFFDGQGHEEGHSYQFDGTFQKGRRKQGKLTWKGEDGDYVYQGPFNQKNQFQGQGTLTEPKGSYKGSFIKGKKSGKGVYEYKSGIIYDGHYLNDFKQGLGTIYNNDGCIAYSGQFKNGLPNGKGVVYNQRNEKIEGQFKDGIDVLLLQQGNTPITGKNGQSKSEKKTHSHEHRLK